jgi:hypothetical protein
LYACRKIGGNGFRRSRATLYIVRFGRILRRVWHFRSRSAVQR